MGDSTVPGLPVVSFIFSRMTPVVCSAYRETLQRDVELMMTFPLLRDCRTKLSINRR